MDQLDAILTHALYKECASRPPSWIPMDRSEEPLEGFHWIAGTRPRKGRHNEWAPFMLLAFFDSQVWQPEYPIEKGFDPVRSTRVSMDSAHIPESSTCGLPDGWTVTHHIPVVSPDTTDLELPESGVMAGDSDR
ncbi:MULTISPECIES: hypothetical protein [unclassified Thioalkalivibrio]|uniref:hypothetical protein n=1 Tax=unclassified Thioalkalivibrio TaxID=2621013 RepID=UPI00035D7A2D|nr:MULTISPECIES: hypothetical protein [unclassified Thioalkalivibrio]